MFPDIPNAVYPFCNKTEIQLLIHNLFTLPKLKYGP